MQSKTEACGHYDFLRPSSLACHCYNKALQRTFQSPPLSLCPSLLPVSENAAQSHWKLEILPLAFQFPMSSYFSSLILYHSFFAFLIVPLQCSHFLCIRHVSRMLVLGPFSVMTCLECSYCVILFLISSLNFYFCSKVIKEIFLMNTYTGIGISWHMLVCFSTFLQMNKTQFQT